MPASTNKRLRMLAPRRAEAKFLWDHFNATSALSGPSLNPTVTLSFQNSPNRPDELLNSLPRKDKHAFRTRDNDDYTLDVDFYHYKKAIVKMLDPLVRLEGNDQDETSTPIKGINRAAFMTEAKLARDNRLVDATNDNYAHHLQLKAPRQRKNVNYRHTPALIEKHPIQWDIEDGRYRLIVCEEQTERPALRTLLHKAQDAKRSPLYKALKTLLDKVQDSKERPLYKKLQTLLHKAQDAKRSPLYKALQALLDEVQDAKRSPLYKALKTLRDEAQDSDDPNAVQFKEVVRKNTDGSRSINIHATLSYTALQTLYKRLKGDLLELFFYSAKENDAITLLVENLPAEHFKTAEGRVYMTETGKHLVEEKYHAMLGSIQPSRTRADYVYVVEKTDTTDPQTITAQNTLIAAAKRLKKKHPDAFLRKLNAESKFYMTEEGKTLLENYIKKTITFDGSEKADEVRVQQLEEMHETAQLFSTPVRQRQIATQKAEERYKTHIARLNAYFKGLEKKGIIQPIRRDRKADAILKISRSDTPDIRLYDQERLLTLLRETRPMLESDVLWNRFTRKGRRMRRSTWIREALLAGLDDAITILERNPGLSQRALYTLFSDDNYFGKLALDLGMIRRIHDYINTHEKFYQNHRTNDFIQAFHLNDDEYFRTRSKNKTLGYKFRYHHGMVPHKEKALHYAHKYRHWLIGPIAVFILGIWGLSIGSRILQFMGVDPTGVSADFVNFVRGAADGTALWVAYNPIENLLHIPFLLLPGLILAKLVQGIDKVIYKALHFFGPKRWPENPHLVMRFLNFLVSIPTAIYNFGKACVKECYHSIKEYGFFGAIAKGWHNAKKLPGRCWEFLKTVPSRIKNWVLGHSDKPCVHPDHQTLNAADVQNAATGPALEKSALIHTCGIRNPKAPIVTYANDNSPIFHGMGSATRRMQDIVKKHNYKNTGSERVAIWRIALANLHVADHYRDTRIPHELLSSTEADARKTLKHMSGLPRVGEDAPYGKEYSQTAMIQNLKEVKQFLGQARVWEGLRRRQITWKRNYAEERVNSMVSDAITLLESDTFDQTQLRLMNNILFRSLWGDVYSLLHAGDLAAFGSNALSPLRNDFINTFGDNTGIFAGKPSADVYDAVYAFLGKEGQLSYMDRFKALGKDVVEVMPVRTILGWTIFFLALNAAVPEAGKFIEYIEQIPHYLFDAVGLESWYAAISETPVGKFLKDLFEKYNLLENASHIPIFLAPLSPDAKEEQTDARDLAAAMVNFPRRAARIVYDGAAYLYHGGEKALFPEGAQAVDLKRKVLRSERDVSETRPTSPKSFDCVKGVKSFASMVQRSGIAQSFTEALGASTGIAMAPYQR